MNEAGGAGQLSGFSYQILRYARFLANEDGSKLNLTSSSRSDQKWKYVNPAGKDGLNLTINSGHFLLICDDIILENYYLPDMRSTMRGFIRGDSLLFVIKIKNEARKFRVRFAKGPHPRAEMTCEDCASKLSFFFPVKPFEPPEIYKPVKKNAQDSGKEIIEGELPMPDLTKVISRDANKVLPLPYMHPSTHGLNSEDLKPLLRLFLSEANFPAFVDSVAKELDSIMNSKEEE